jgi:hypothetical protein
MHRLLALALLLAACGSPTTTSDTTARADESSTGDDAQMAPTPYTAEQIRDASRASRVYLWNVTRPGEPASQRRLTFIAVTPEGAETESVSLDAQGAVLGETTRSSATWAELQTHASFPASSVTITEDTRVVVPAGEFVGPLYVVTDGEDVMRFWFASDRPGPPVRMEIQHAGTVVETSELAQLSGGD